MVTTAERWMAEGKIAMLQSLIAEKFPDASPVDLGGFSQTQLEQIGRRILKCETLDEVLKGLR